MLVIFAVICLVMVYGVARLFTTPSRAKAITSSIVLAHIIFPIVIGAGLLFSYLYEPRSYWDSMHIFNIFDTAFFSGDGDGLWRLFLIGPFAAIVMIWINLIMAVITQLSVAVIAMLLFGIWLFRIFNNIAWMLVSDPTEAEMARMQRTLRSLTGAAEPAPEPSLFTPSGEWVVDIHGGQKPASVVPESDPVAAPRTLRDQLNRNRGR